MPNDEVYAAGLLNRALDPSTQPPEIRAFLQAEIDLLHDVIVAGMRVIDVGCGTGRHLGMLSDRLRIGVGLDYEHSYIVEAHRRVGARTNTKGEAGEQKRQGCNGNAFRSREGMIGLTSRSGGRPAAAMNSPVRPCGVGDAGSETTYK